MTAALKIGEVADTPGSFHLPGLTCRWDGPHHNQFAGASVSVSILIAAKMRSLIG